MNLRRLAITAALVVVPAVAGATTAASALPWVENDYAKAIARAKTKNLPVFVEAWAPW